MVAYFKVALSLSDCYHRMIFQTSLLSSAPFRTSILNSRSGLPAYFPRSLLSPLRHSLSCSHSLKYSLTCMFSSFRSGCLITLQYLDANFIFSTCFHHHLPLTGTYLSVDPYHISNIHQPSPRQQWSLTTHLLEEEEGKPATVRTKEEGNPAILRAVDEDTLAILRAEEEVNLATLRTE